MTRNVTLAWLVASLLGCSLSACQSSGGGQGTPPVGAAPAVTTPGAAPTSTSVAIETQPDAGMVTKPIQNCTELGERACSGLDQCAPFLMQAYYGKKETCQSLFTRICETLNTEGTPVDLGRCSTVLGSCGSFNENNGVPRWCWVPRGKSALGDICVRDTDCADGLCERMKGYPSGTCAAPVKAGEYCGPARCALGLRCASDGTCVAPLADGATCNNSLDCLVGSICSASGVCAPTAVGDSCADGILPCNTGLGQWCVTDHCLAMTWANDNTSCLNGGVQCPGTDRCLVTQVTAMLQSGQCGPAADFGAACGASAPCIEPLACRAGICRP